MSGDDSDDANESWYTRQFEPPRFPEEAYGYWMSVTGLVLSILAVGFLLLETTAGDGTPLFWTARQAAAVFAGAGFPLVVLGFVYRLPVGANVHRLAFAGVVVCLVALVVFVRAYPDGWGVNPDTPAADISSQVVAVYAAGLFLTVLSATVVPTMTQARQEVVEELPAERGAEFEVFRDVSADWRWRLLDSDGGVVAESDEGYPSEKEAERSLEGFREGVEGASVETRDVLEEQMLSEEASVEKGAGHTKTPEIGTREEDAEFEVREDEEGWRWSLRDGEGKALASQSGTHEDRDGAEASAEAVCDIAGEAGVVDAEPAFVAVYRDDDVGWRWSLRDGEGKALASSPDVYEDRDGVDTALERLASGEGLETEILEEIEEADQEDGGWRWRLVHTNGEVLAVSDEMHEERAEAEEAAETAEKLLAEAEAAEVKGGYFAVYRDETDGWVWSLHDEDGEKIAVPGEEEGEPERHGSRDETLAAVERVRRCAHRADIRG